MILSSLKHGFAQMRSHKRMVLVFYLANLFFGVMLLLPFRAMLIKYLGDSAMGAKLAGPLDMDFLFEFLFNNESVLATQASLLLIVPLCYWLFGLFLSGGAFSVFASQELYAPSRFWSGAAKYFGRFVRLALYGLPVLAVLFCVQYLALGVQRLVWGEDAYQNISYWGGWTRLGITALCMILFGAIFDYARVHAVLHEENKMRVSMWQGIKFTFGNLFSAFGLAFIVFLAGAALLALYDPLANSFSAANGFIILLLFLVQQAYVFTRMALKLALYAGEVHLYQQCAAATQTDSTPETNADLEGLAPAME
jgi:hypothetical protein